MDLRRILKTLLVTRLRYNDRVLSIQFHPDSPVHPEKLVELIKKKKEQARLLPNMTLVFSPFGAENCRMVAEAKKLLGELGSLCELR